MPPGTRVSERYVVVNYLCSGGMGDVYEVEHTLLGRRFALKRLTAERTAKAHHVERFVREARAAAATGHPGVVEVVDLGFAAEGWPFLVMERLHGENLRQRLRRGSLDTAEIVHLGRVALDALDAVHRCGVVHRDIKPENLFLCGGPDEVPRLKILDFGLADLRMPDAPEVSLTQSGSVVGTPHYMAPEQARGVEVDHRADLYGVGAVLFECATGRPPFTASTYAALVAKILEEPPDEAALDHIDPQVSAVILRALAKRPEQRFSDAALMRRVLCGEPSFGPVAVPIAVAAAGSGDGASPEPFPAVIWPTEVPTLDDASGDGAGHGVIDRAIDDGADDGTPRAVSSDPTPLRPMRAAIDADPTERIRRLHLPPPAARWREAAMLACGAVLGAVLTALAIVGT